jgi:AcrR family transcriptional regulator
MVAGGKACDPDQVSNAGEDDPTRRGRPSGPSPQVRAAVLDAAGEELAASGYAAFSAERVVERAGVHRSTLYRHWPTKRDLIVAVARASYAERLPSPDTGTWEGDLRALVDGLVDSIAAPVSRALFGALAAAGRSDPELQEAVMAMWRADTARHLAPIERAQSRGEVDASVDPGLLLETISAPLVERLGVTGAPVTPHFLEFNIQLVLRGTRPAT